MEAGIMVFLALKGFSFDRNNEFSFLKQFFEYCFLLLDFSTESQYSIILLLKFDICYLNKPNFLNT